MKADEEGQKPSENNFEQMSFKKEKDIFVEIAVSAMFKEYKQMEDMAVLAAIDLSKLTKEQKRKALRAVNLIKQKICGKVKD